MNESNEVSVIESRRMKLEQSGVLPAAVMSVVLYNAIYTVLQCRGGGQLLRWNSCLHCNVN
jgi:hypothetical protein